MPTTETLIVIGGITIAGLAWLLMPFFVGRSPSQEKVEEKQLERLLMYYEQVMATLRDLEEDYLTGKLNQKDYEEEREAWSARGVKVLSAINQVNPDAGTEPAPQPAQELRPVQQPQDDIDAAIEAAVSKALRAK